MTTAEHLNAISAKCRANLALAENRMPGNEGNACFIAACAASAESGWRSTIAAIEGFKIQKVRFELEKFQLGIDSMNAALASILAAWPDELLS